MNDQKTLILSRKDVAQLLSVSECITAVESAFRMFAERKVAPPGILGMHVSEGGFHIKAGTMQCSRNYFVAKLNGNFPTNGTKYSLPTIQGVVIVCDADDGSILAVMDSIEITIVRTGAATGVAAKYLSRPDSKTVTICGCGNQGRVSLRALVEVRNIRLAYAYDTDLAKAEQFAEELSEDLNLEVVAVTNLRAATLQSDICVTCTPSKEALMFSDFVRPGTFIAAVGADGENKLEIDPALIASSKLIVDLTQQSATIGDFHHALCYGHLRISHIHAELGDVVAGAKPGREHADEIIIFDSTGTGIQDVAAAAIVFERALACNIGLEFDFQE